MTERAAARGDYRLSPLFLRPFVFGTGAAVMAVEFSAERLMGPFFGNSQLVWATLIGLILLALSIGYAVGGRLADRWHQSWECVSSGTIAIRRRQP